MNENIAQAKKMMVQCLLRWMAACCNEDVSGDRLRVIDHLIHGVFLT